MLSAQKIKFAETLGPVVVDIEGPTLTEHEVRRLEHPLTGAVILFSRNFSSMEMLRALTGAIHAVRPGILVAVDHEGGRVQRFREGFSPIPPMGDLRRFGAESPSLYAAAGYLLASELRSAGVDFTFAPVLDLDYGRSAVIGNRSLGSTPEEVESNARALLSGLRAAGMANCGKHFPGHGWAEADSHLAMPEDDRDAEAVKRDLVLYRRLASELESVMTAHVAYRGFGGETATYSTKLLVETLRNELGFTGLVFSDDLSMKGAGTKEPPAARAQRALAAGCDMVLHCNHPEEVDELLAQLVWERPEPHAVRLAQIMPDEGTPLSPEVLRQTPRWREARALLESKGLL